MFNTILSSGFVSLLLLISTLVTDSHAIVTTGVKNSGIGIRREVRDLINDKNAWNVFLLGLSAMQNESQSNIQGYFQIAAIHGAPAIAYDGVQGVRRPQIEGYCTHRSNYFLTWHRPYLALYEQLVQSHAMAQVNKFPAGARKNAYLAAARRFRLPYWDWTQNSTRHTAFPTAFTSKTANVVMAQKGRVVTQRISNPLYSFRFRPNARALGDDFSNDPTTLRSPRNGASQQEVTRDQIDQLMPGLHDRLYKVLTNYTSYNSVSNEAWIESSNVDDQDSMEAIHDNVHTAVGGTSGHMTFIQDSAYDPVFWLHHCMVDRAFALWQGLHPKARFQPQRQTSPSYWYNVGVTSRATDGLKPFKKDSSGAFWTSNDVQDWTKFGYTYPELPSGHTPRSVRAAVDKLYSNREDPTITARPPSIPRSVSRVRRAEPAEDEEDVAIQYFINVRANKNALLKPYFIYAFLGEAGDSSSWTTNKNVAGVQGFTARSLTEEQAKDLPPAYVAAAIPLNRAIKRKIDSGELKYKNSEDINDYLKENLSWQVLASDGTVYDADDVPDLVLSVGQTVEAGSSTAAASNAVASSEAVALSDGFIGNGNNRNKDDGNKGDRHRHRFSSLLTSITDGKHGGLKPDQSKWYRWDGD